MEIVTTGTNSLVDAIAQARARTLNMVTKDIFGSRSELLGSRDDDDDDSAKNNAGLLPSSAVGRSRRFGSSSKFLSFSSLVVKTFHIG
jgi:hypothetical protein